MQAIDVSKRTIGINFTEDGMAVVNVWSPLADKVMLITDEEVIELAKQDLGYWHAVSDRLKEGSTYKIKVNDNSSFPDPASLSQPNGVHGESEVIDLNSFQWSNTTWNNLPLEDYIIYELHTGCFTEEGTFSSIERKLDYLKELGITAIELMPIAQFPGHRNWGYDGVYPFDLQNSYGGPKGLQQLVDACHQKGIAVILDVV